MATVATMAIEALLLAAGNLGLVLVTMIAAGMLLYNRLRRIPPSAYAEMEQTLTDMTRQMSDLSRQQADDHSEMRRLRTEIARIDRALQEYADRFLALTREFKEATGREPATRPPGPEVVAAAPAPAAVDEQGRLKQLIAELFDAEEIATLAFDLGLSRSLKGDTPDERARALVGAAGRRGKLDKLTALARQERPDGGF